MCLGVKFDCFLSVSHHFHRYNEIFKSSGRKLRKIEQEYSALLTLYGEKVEVVEELRLDLADVKQLLRQQTEEWANQQSANDSSTEPPPTQ